jgi:hypothetical protein
MKTILSGFVLLGILISCNDNASQTGGASNEPVDTALSAQIEPAEKTKPAINDVLSSYLQIKNGLTADDAKDAAAGGKAMVDALTKVDDGAFSSAEKKTFNDVKEDIRENAEHISVNEAKIAHQREHFDMLSKDMYDLIKAVNPAQTLYLDYCPMYNEGKGANWLSEVKEIKNPYLGKKMPECGSVKETLSR